MPSKRRPKKARPVVTYTLAEIVRDRMFERRFSINALYKASGVSRGTIAGFVTGTTSIKAENLDLLFVALDLVTVGKESVK
jgi:hypothetical protein